MDQDLARVSSLFESIFLERGDIIHGGLSVTEDHENKVNEALVLVTKPHLVNLEACRCLIPLLISWKGEINIRKM